MTENFMLNMKDEHRYHLKPYACPICGGRGTVPSNFYSNYGSTTMANIEETCRTCNGAGILWG